jgi:hypothetical protein
MPMFSQ